jgi:NADPH-dependent FMN reductase
VLSRPADTTSGVANQPQHDMTSFGKAAIAMKLGMIVGSTRPNRFADMPVQWLAEGGSARPDLRLTVLDLRDYPLPFFNEPASRLTRRHLHNSRMESASTWDCSASTAHS